MADWELTRWTMFSGLNARKDEAAFHKAWEDLYTQYRAVFVRFTAFCLRRMGGHGLAANEAENVVADFFTACLEKDWLTRADPAKGRFRTFARKLLARFAKDWMVKRKAKKRNPESGALVSVDDHEGTIRDPGAKELDDAMDQEWAEHLIARALDALRERNERNAIAIEALKEDPDITHDDLALRMGMPAKRVGVQLFRARGMFAAELWKLVKETVQDLETFDQERTALRPWLERYLDIETARSLFDGVIDDDAPQREDEAS